MAFIHVGRTLYQLVPDLFPFILRNYPDKQGVRHVNLSAAAVGLGLGVVKGLVDPACQGIIARLETSRFLRPAKDFGDSLKFLVNLAERAVVDKIH